MPAAQASPLAFGVYLFQTHWLAVEIASMLLLVALVGAYVLGRRVRPPLADTQRGGAVIVPLNHILLLSGLLFSLGMLCILARRNLIMILLGIEIMLNAAAVAFAGASLHWQQMEGQAIVIFILAIAATEVSIGLAAILVIYRRTDSVDPDIDAAMWEKGGTEDSHATGHPDSPSA
jgi:NADH-quinone oxidoreductase subunit K